MPRNCFVPQCTVNSEKCKGVSFFGFPKNSTLRKKWLISVKNAREPTRCSAVCSRHFTEDDFISSKDEANVVIFRKLKADAIPHCHLPVRKVENPVDHQKVGTAKVKAQKNDRDLKIRIKPYFTLKESDDVKPKITRTQNSCVVSFSRQRLESYTNIESIENSQAKQTSCSPLHATALQKLTSNIIPLPSVPKKSAKCILKESESRSILKCRQMSQTKQVQSDLSTDTITPAESIYFKDPSPTIPKISVNSVLQTIESSYLSQSSKHSAGKQQTNHSINVNALQQSTPRIYLMLTLPQTSAGADLFLQTSESCSTPESRQNLIARGTTDLPFDSTLHQELMSITNHLTTPADKSPNSALHTPNSYSIIKSSQNSVTKKQFWDLSADATAHQELSSSSNLSDVKDKVSTPNRACVDDALLAITNEMNLDCSLAKLKRKLQKERIGLP